MTDWYVIRTNPNSELKATSELRRHGIRVYLPKHSYEVRNRRSGAVSVKHRPLYIGYLFIRFPGVPHFLTLRDCQGVKGVLKFLNDQDEWQPLPVPDSQVRLVMQRQRAKDYDGVKLAELARKKLYAKGNKLRVEEGPFKGFMAEIMKLHRNGTVDTDIEIFGRPTRVSFDEPDIWLKDVA